MDGSYYARQTLHSTLSTFLEAHGLNPCPMPLRRPPPAPTLDKQLERVAIFGRAIAAIGQQMPVGPDDRRMIALFVDAACDERDRNAPRPLQAPEGCRAPRRIQSARWTRKGFQA
jgi:hypothetical protein